MRTAAWGLTLAALASMASAITLDDCEDMGTATAFTYDFSKTCYKGTVRHTFEDAIGSCLHPQPLNKGRRPAAMLASRSLGKNCGGTIVAASLAGCPSAAP